ncbi:MAG: protein translocase subunit SecF [Nanoarchaeota archaeon]|nr:protein translocase subunit SecF [Nanoarchaeota archaeon]MBU1029689.1 protein translocase subunit SecF [Nanoarchaeota archaeon]MBU1767823.1 protein translocase subunit SecF [Candidatus Omnitrophota bacterium]MBU1849928.1 protein translocase subunit SecF [Nanoarchaeota archaeon]
MKQSRKIRRKDFFKKNKKSLSEETEEKTAEVKEVLTPKTEKKNYFLRIYDEEYKKLLLIPILLLIFSFIIIGSTIITTGDFVNKGVSLKGGLTLTIPTEVQISAEELNNFLSDRFLQSDISVRQLSELGSLNGLIVEASDIEEELLTNTIEEKIPDIRAVYSVESMGPTLGKSFFRQTMIAILIAFLFMGLVVFYYFRTFVPSLAVIMSAFSDIVITIAIFNLLNMKLSTAGVAAFLMLIGYSVDTDILLSTRVLKRKEGTVMSRILGAMSTGLTMSATTIVAVTIALIVSQSDVIRQIMTILLIGLLVDLINTWIQNVGIIRLYLEKRKPR